MEREEQEHVSKWTGQEYTQEQHRMQSEKLGNKYTKRSFLMKVTQSCLTLCNPMDCRLPQRCDGKLIPTFSKVLVEWGEMSPD